MLYALSFFFGASIGSYVLVLVTRLNVAPVTRARSKCLSCGEALRAHDLVPVISYLVLHGKCRYCKTPYGLMSLGVEVLYGVFFVLLYHFFLIGQTPLLLVLWLVYYTLLFIVLGVIALYDMKHTYIPYMYLLAYLVLTFVMLIVRYGSDPSPLHLLGPMLIAAPFFFLYIITRGRGLGFGDVLLFLGVGAFFGVSQGFAVFLISVWIGALFGIVSYLVKKRTSQFSTVIPFVPFIVIAFLFVLFTDINIFSIASLFA